MSELFTRLCDLCKRSMDWSNIDYKVKIIRKDYSGPEPLPKKERLDICSVCMSQIEKYIREKRKEGVNETK